MLEFAVRLPNIDYQACPAEKLPFDDSSVDVITSAQAFHWFKHDQFFKEAKRVLKPNGTIAIMGYAFARIKGSPKASELIEQLGVQKLDGYWGKLVETGGFNFHAHAKVCVAFRRRKSTCGQSIS